MEHLSTASKIVFYKLSPCADGSPDPSAHICFFPTEWETKKFADNLLYFHHGLLAKHLQEGHLWRITTA
jgi:hypothetical protein